MKLITPASAVRTTLLIVCFLYALGASYHASAETWTRAAVVDNAEITVYVVTEEQLRKLQRRRHISQMITPTPGGYAVLGKIAGRDVCHIYVTSEATPETIEHEKRHCAGWIHK